MADSKKEGVAGRRWTVASVAVTGLFHLVATALVFVIVVAVTMPLDAAWAAVSFAWDTESIRGAVNQGLAIQLGLSACVWAVLYIVYRVGRRRVEQARTPQVVGPARGTVITETLVAMPVLLLLILGMMQLAINNMAGILNQVASFQAARTVWVWEQEPGVEEQEVKDRVRIAVAQTMAPVAPGRFPSAHDDDLSDRAEHTRDFMTARFQGWNPIEGMIPSFGSPDLTVPSGLDGGQSEYERAGDKFTHAYGSMDPEDISYTHNETGDGPAGTLVVEVDYYHFQSMPLVGRIFGQDEGGIGSSNAYYQVQELEFEIPRQMYDVGRP